MVRTRKRVRMPDKIVYLPDPTDLFDYLERIAIEEQLAERRKKREEKKDEDL